MRIGLYGLPTSGKTFVLNAVRNLEALSGSTLLRKINPDFSSLTETKKQEVRERLAFSLMKKDQFIMDGHYSFGEKVVFTEADGQLYDMILYLYTEPKILKERMRNSIRNQKYLKHDIQNWQFSEIENLREYCQKHDKDFYVLDNPEKGFFPDISIVLEFIDSIVCGFSCVRFAKECTKNILSSLEEKEIVLTDGDKTLLIEDSCGMLGYSTHLFDGNFYTGFQSWRHARELTDYLRGAVYSGQSLTERNLHLNRKVLDQIKAPGVILSSGHCGIWERIARQVDMPYYGGNQMAADTKYFIVKMLQKAGIHVTAYGDGMNDYYMLKQADKAFLVLKQNGTVSSSLKGRNVEGITFV